jgi:hypothetical protein
MKIKFGSNTIKKAIITVMSVLHAPISRVGAVITTENIAFEFGRWMRWKTFHCLFDESQIS